MLPIEREKIIEAVNIIGSAFPIFGASLNGSDLWQQARQLSTGEHDQYEIDLGTLNVNTGSIAHRLVFTYRDLERRKEGTAYGVLLPTTHVNSQDIVQGKKEIILRYENRNPTQPWGFRVDMHAGEPNIMEFQVGHKREPIQFNGDFQTLGQIGSDVFLQTQSKKEIIDTLFQLLNKPEEKNRKATL